MINNMLKSMKIIFSCILIIVMFTFITIPFTFAGENQNSDLFLPNASVNSYCEKPFHETTEKEIEKLKEEISEYGKATDDNIKTRSSYTSGKSYWWYNTGLTCPETPNYSRYNLIDIVKPGDIVYERKGGSKVTGHISIVEGIFEYNGKKYIRVIEAILEGICRSVLDDDRVDARDATIISLPPEVDTSKAINFCKKQLGKPYNLDFTIFTPPKTSIDSKGWYCSELVWAAYQYAGYDIEYKHDVSLVNHFADEYINSLVISPLEILLGGVSANTTYYKLLYYRHVDIDSDTVSFSWRKLPFVKGYLPYVGFKNQGPSVYVNEEGYPLSNAEIPDEYYQKTYITVNKSILWPNSEYQFTILASNRYHNGIFPYPVSAQSLDFDTKGVNITMPSLNGRYYLGGNTPTKFGTKWKIILEWDRNEYTAYNVIYDQYLWPIDFYDSGSNELNEKRLDVFIRYESDSKTEIFYIIGYVGDCNATEPSKIEIFLRHVIV